MEEVNANREHKDRFFKKVFSTKKALLSLYNAVNGTDYDNPDDIEINTIEDFLYLSMKNDVSFLFTETMNLYEHQSTVNPNMPFRGFMYFAKLYQKTLFADNDFFSSSLIKIPTPQFVVFYNGTKDEPDVSELRLGDAFSEEGRFKPAIECTATVLNINYEHNKELMEKCKELRDYALLIHRIRKYRAEGQPLANAIDLAIDDCIRDDVLRDILETHRMEARDMLFTEYNEEVHIKNEKEISYKDGYGDGYDNGMDTMSRLYNKLEELDRLGEFSKAVKDPEYRTKLIEELLA